MLVIKNWDKIMGDTFVDGRFLCTNHRETAATIDFWFKDLTDKIPEGGIWVSINRSKVWDSTGNHSGWYYDLDYPNILNRHRISANWFSDIDNVRATFDDALKVQ